MPRNPDIHPYSDHQSFQRLMLLIAAIAQNPGIAPQRRRNEGADPMESIQQAMIQIAADEGIDYRPYALNTLRKDLRVLRAYEIIPKRTAMRAGYYLGKEQKRQVLKRTPIVPRKSKLSVCEIIRLRTEEKLTLEAIGKRAGLSRQRIQQILDESQ